MEWIKLIGIFIILVGFIFKFDTIAVVIIAAFTTALVSGISITEFFTLLGEAFVKNRIVTIFLLKSLNFFVFSLIEAYPEN